MSKTASTFALPGFGISGKAGSGKTTLAKLVMERLAARGAAPVRIAFAAPLKAEVLHFYDLRKGQTGWREAAVKHGAFRRETQGEDYWVTRSAKMLDTLAAHGRTPVIDDVRLLNELGFLTSRGMLCARLDAPAGQRAARLRANGLEPEAAYSDDETECELDDVDFALRYLNDDEETVADLRSPADRLCRLALTGAPQAGLLLAA